MDSVAPSDARLPATYEAARNAIAECERIDECKTWSDKAAALASYARQAKDDGLRVMAVRTQARAERRCGELLKQIPRADQSTRYGQVGDHPPVTRTQAAAEAGLSEHQKKTALRIASVPAADFDRQVDSPTPPTVTQLANQGKETRVVPADSIQSAESDGNDACEALRQIHRFCGEYDASTAARTIPRQHVATCRRLVAVIDQWLDRFVINLSD